eukprot:TRINITY_DN34620_c0_g1_i1.p1 TRINITY_DN34620_c0_g1~~TRINITY_DN34620_c0_g1_i1.p1  ORF type:complete len:1577 (+),score=285.87 TRINITY_DN34620_c0_g1_i1:184-4914(+)
MNATGSNATLAGAGRASYFERWSNDFVDRNWTLIVFMMLELIIAVGLYIYHIMWVKIQRKRAKTSAVMLLTEEFSLELLRRFLPDARAEKYRFRGMSKKQASASVSFEDICLDLPNGQRILEGVSGEFRAGRMCAIMGPSGAGKTSLMNVLCGKASYANATGVIRFSGREGKYEEYKTVMGFVPQEDVVHEGLTVGEQIHFSAELRTPYDTNPQRRKAIAEDVLSVMQLSNIQNSIVGGLENRGISGGQRKRVSIGLELAADPTMLFLDEPTSGLDAAASLAIVHSLKRMAQLGMTSVMVVHQPRYSLYSLFDDVLLLGKGGRTVYLGPALGAKPYFERLGFMVPLSENPADWFMDLISGDVPNRRIPRFHPEMLFDLWEANKHSVERSAKAREKALMEVDEWELLVKKLDEDWPRISYRNAPSAMDPGRNGVLREQDLLRLLRPKYVNGGTYSEDELDDLEDVNKAMRQLLSRIAGPSAFVATKTDVLQFLAGLQGVVADDKDVKKEESISKMMSLRSDRSIRSARSGRSALQSHSNQSTPRTDIIRDQAASRYSKKKPSMIPEGPEERAHTSTQPSPRPDSHRGSTSSASGQVARKVFQPEALHSVAPPSPALPPVPPQDSPQNAEADESQTVESMATDVTDGAPNVPHDRGPVQLSQHHKPRDESSTNQHQARGEIEKPMVMALGADTAGKASSSCIGLATVSTDASSGLAAAHPSAMSLAGAHPSGTSLATSASQMGSCASVAAASSHLPSLPRSKTAMPYVGSGASLATDVSASAGQTIPVVRSGLSLAGLVREPKSSGARAPPRPKEFHIFLEQLAGASFGAILSSEDTGAGFHGLKVKAIIAGQLRDWNDSNSTLPVKKGDHIVEVNGVKGSPAELLQELKKDVALDIVIRARDHKRPQGTPRQTALEDSGVVGETPAQVVQPTSGLPSGAAGGASKETPVEASSGANSGTQAEGALVAVSLSGHPPQQEMSILSGHRGDDKVSSSGIPVVPKLRLQSAASAALAERDAKEAPRGLHASSAEAAKSAEATPAHSDGLDSDSKSLQRAMARVKGGRSSGPASATSAASSYSDSDSDALSVGAEASRVRIGRSGLRAADRDQAIRMLSPRTRAVWSKHMAPAVPDSPLASSKLALASPGGFGRQIKVKKHVELRDDVSAVSASEFSVDASEDLDRPQLEVVVELSLAATERSKRGKSTRSLASLGRLKSIATKTKPPGFGRQLILLIHRSSIQWWRGNWQRAIFLAVISGSAVVLAVLDTFVQKEAEWQVLPILNLHTTLALLSAVFCLNVFSTDRPVFWRERESGLSVAAFYISKVLVNTIDLLLQCFLLAAIYYMIAQPYIDFTLYFTPFLLVSFSSAGLGYTISAIFPPKHGPFITAIVIFVSGGLLGHPLRIATMADGAGLELMMDVLSITRWSVGYYFECYLDHTDLEQFAGDKEALKEIAEIREIYITGPQLFEKVILGARTEVLFLVCMGLFWHVLGYVILVLSHWGSQFRNSQWKGYFSHIGDFLDRTLDAVLNDEWKEWLEKKVEQIDKVFPALECHGKEYKFCSSCCCCGRFPEGDQQSRC